MTDRPSLTLTFLAGAESIGASCAVLEALTSDGDDPEDPR